jgi:hypothetical protein
MNTNQLNIIGLNELLFACRVIQWVGGDVFYSCVPARDGDSVAVAVHLTW